MPPPPETDTNESTAALPSQRWDVAPVVPGSESTNVPAPSQEGNAGTSAGINVAPGSGDDGWVVPPPVTLADGSIVQLYKDGEALHAGANAIKNAKSRICVESYIWGDDDTGHAFADLLCQRARDGLKVFAIYDSFGSLGPAGLWRPKPEMFDRMRSAGVRVQEFHPIRPWEGTHGWRPVNRDHRKLIVCDDNVAGMGGLNLAQEYAGSWVISGKTKCEPWRDNAIGVRGPAVRQLLHAFARTWNYCVKGGRIARAEYRCNLREGDFGVLASVPSMNSPLKPWLCSLLRESHKSIDMTIAYFAPDDALIAELVKAAKRGVKIRLMLPGRSDVQALIAAARSFYQRLMDVGVEIYERQGAILHAKTISIDRRTSIVGSTNLDTRSIEFNLELSAIVRSEIFGQQMADLFANDIRYAKRIDPREWPSRPWRDRFGQWCVSRMRYLL